VNRGELIAAFRARVFDTAAPYLWSDAEAIEYLEDAIIEACERADLIRDDTTAQICQITVTAGTAKYPLDVRITQVLRAKLDGEAPKRPLTLATTEGMDRDWPGWDEREDGEPEYLVIDPQGTGWNGRLVPGPSEGGTLLLQVYRLPLDVLADNAAMPEILPRLHIRLLDWMCFRAYSKQDAETRDDDKAAAHAAAFTASFGPKRDARYNRHQHDMQFPVVRPSPL
jgi:hypothetical protein